MTVKPLRSGRIAWYVGLALFAVVAYAVFSGFRNDPLLLVCLAAILIVSFPYVFSVYELTEQGVDRKCVCFHRFYPWDSFAFIGRQHLYGGGTPAQDYIRMCTVLLLKTMTQKQLEHKIFWPPFQTVSIDWRGEAFYQQVLQYAGGERDIRK